MTTLFKNIQEYKQKYADELAKPQNKDLTDQKIADFVYEKYNSARPEDNQLDYFSFMQEFLPEGNLNNVDKYRQKFNIPAELSDLEVARNVFKKAQDDKTKSVNINFGNFANTFAPKYGTGRTGRVQVPYTMTEITDVLPDVDAKTDFNTTMGRLGAGLAMDEMNANLVILDQAKKYFGKIDPNLMDQVKLREGKDTGALEIFNPVTQKFQLVNRPGADAGDITSQIGNATVIASELIGYGLSRGKGFLGGAKGVSAGAIAGTAAEMARLYAGHEIFGINKELEGFTDYLNQAKGVGFVSAVGGTIGEGVAAIPKLFKLFKKGKGAFNKVSPEEMKEFAKDVEDAEMLATIMNNKLAARELSSRVKFSLPQATNDPFLLEFQYAFENSPRYGLKGTFREFNKNNARAVGDFFDAYLNGYSGKNFDSMQGLEIIKGKLQKAVQESQEQKLKSARLNLEKAEDDLTDSVVALPGGSFKTQGKEIRSIVSQLKDDYNKDFNVRYNTLLNVDGLANGGGAREVKKDLIEDALKNIAKKEKESLFALSDNFAGLIKFKPGQPINLRMLHETKSDLLRFKRNLQQGKVLTENPPSEAKINQLVNAINKQMEKDLGADDPWLQAYRQIDTEFMNYKNQFNSILGKLVEKKGNKLMIADEDVFEQTYKTGKSFETRIDDVYDVLKDDTTKLQLYKDEILRHYRNTLDKTGEGKINVEAHKKYLNQYDYALKKFFGPEGAKDLQKIGNLEKKVVESKDNLDKIAKELATATESKIVSLDPADIFQQTFKSGEFGGGATQKLKQVVGIMKQDTDLLKNFQNVVTKKMYDNTTLDGRFSSAKFDKFYQGNLENLKVVFADNPEYMRDLKTFKDVLNVLQRQQKTVPEDIQKSAINDLIRAKVGQFTVAGRTMTAANKIFNRHADKQLARLMLDPKALKEFISLKDKPPGFLETKKGRTLLQGILRMPIQYSDPPAPELTPDESELDFINRKSYELQQEEVDDQSAAPSPTVDMVAMEQMPRPTEPAPIAPPPVQQPQPAGIASLPQDRGQTYAGLFPNDPSGQMIAQRGTQDA